MAPEKIWELCAQGDEAAWEFLVRAHKTRVFNVCYRFTRSNSEAQDLTQEVFFRVFRKARTFRAAGTGSLQIWMTCMTRNLLIDSYRRKRQDRLTESLRREPCGQDARPDRLVLARELRERLHKHLRKLPPELRDVLMLRITEEMDYNEIACKLGIPEGTVKSRLNRARAGLARLIPRKVLTE